MKQGFSSGMLLYVKVFKFYNNTFDVRISRCLQKTNDFSNDTGLFMFAIVVISQHHLLSHVFLCNYSAAAKQTQQLERCVINPSDLCTYSR